MADLGLTLEEGRSQFEETIQSYNEALKKIRAGRLNMDQFSNLQVEAYETKQPLSHLATINLLSARSLSVKPWDQSNLKAVEDALRAEFSDYTINTQKDQILVNMPVLTQESRQGYIKELKDETEKFRKSLRDIRNRIRDHLNSQKDDLPEEDFMRSIKEVDEVSKEYTDKLQEVYDKKERELTEG